MNSAPFPESSANELPWSAAVIIEQQPARQAKLFQWWYSFTTPASAHTSYVKREADRKARLLSMVVFFFLATLIFFIPATLQMPISTFYLDLITIAITLGALLVNKNGKTLLAGIIIVVTFEIALALGIVLIRSFNETDLQLYDLFIIGELLAISLLPVRNVLIVAVLNSIFTWIDLAYHPHTPVLAQDMATQFLPVLVRPVGLQFIIAGVVFIWIDSATKAIERANRAEMVATLEHAMAEQRASSEQEKRELEESIQQLVGAHVNATNNQIAGRIPYPPARVLWPLVGVINSLWVRLQRTQQTERELQQLKQAISAYNEFIQKRPLSSQHSLSGLRTGTDLDQLVASMKNLYGNTRDY